MEKIVGVGLPAIALAEAGAGKVFIPQFDDDGNQTLIKTSTGIWSVAYNGENRPFSWTCGSTNVAMSFDRIGRRVHCFGTCGVTTNSNNTFTYDNYLLVARNHRIVDGTVMTDRFVWDATEHVATRPLVFCCPNALPQYYTHDGSKNVSERMAISISPNIVSHYEYSAFGEQTVSVRNLTLIAYGLSDDPFRFSSEFEDAVLGLTYYNYRHYSHLTGRWLSRDPLNEFSDHNIYMFSSNSPYGDNDMLGLLVVPPSALIKCASSIISQQIKKYAARYFTNMLLCKKAGESFFLTHSGMERCKPGELLYTGETGDSPPSYDVSTFKEAVLNCFVRTAKGKAIDTLMKDVEDEQLKKLVKVLLQTGEKGIKEYLEASAKDEQGTYRLKYNCNKNKMEVQVMFYTTLRTPDGDIDVSAPVSKKYVCEGGRFPSWKVGIEMMCDCCDNDTEDE